MRRDKQEGNRSLKHLRAEAARENEEDLTYGADLQNDEPDQRGEDTDQEIKRLREAVREVPKLERDLQ